MKKAFKILLVFLAVACFSYASAKEIEGISVGGGNFVMPSLGGGWFKPADVGNVNPVNIVANDVLPPAQAAQQGTAVVGLLVFNPDGSKKGWVMVDASVAGDGRFLIVPAHFAQALVNGDPTTQQFAVALNGKFPEGAETNTPPFGDTVANIYVYPGNADLAIIELNTPVAGATPIPLVAAGDTNTGDSVYVAQDGSGVGVTENIDAINDNKAGQTGDPNSVIVLNGNLGEPGDCGLPLVNSEGQLAGIQFGGTHNGLLGLSYFNIGNYNYKTMFVNLADPTINSWVANIINPAPPAQPNSNGNVGPR